MRSSIIHTTDYSTNYSADFENRLEDKGVSPLKECLSTLLFLCTRQQEISRLLIIP